MIIGITGSIATGKSTVSQYLKDNNFTVIDADVIAKQIVTQGSPILQQLVVAFGKDILQNDGQLNRQYLREMIFENEEQRKKLDNIMHPAILRVMQLQTQIASINQKLVFWDVPLLFESGFNQYVDKTLVIYTTQDKQLDRLMARQSLSLNQAKSMIASQWSIDKKKQLGDDIIDNNYDINYTFQQVDQYIKRM